MLGQIAQGFIQPSVEYPQGQSFHNLLLLSVLATAREVTSTHPSGTTSAPAA